MGRSIRYITCQIVVRQICGASFEFLWRGLDVWLKCALRSLLLLSYFLLVLPPRVLRLHEELIVSGYRSCSQGSSCSCLLVFLTIHSFSFVQDFVVHPWGSQFGFECVFVCLVLFSFSIFDLLPQHVCSVWVQKCKPGVDLFDAFVTQA